MAKSRGRAARGDDVGRERFAVLCRMLLMVFKELGVRMRRTGRVWRRMTFSGGYKLMISVGGRPKQFKVVNRV